MARLLHREPEIARNSDPHTSHVAEERYTLTARAERQRQVLSLVGIYPDRTDGEYARLMLRHYPELPVKIAVETPHKRISDLKRKGLVKVSGTRVCSDSGYECHTYRVTELGRTAMKES